MKKLRITSELNFRAFCIGFYIHDGLNGFIGPIAIRVRYRYVQKSIH